MLAWEPGMLCLNQMWRHYDTGPTVCPVCSTSITGIMRTDETHLRTVYRTEKKGLWSFYKTTMTWNLLGGSWGWCSWQLLCLIQSKAFEVKLMQHTQKTFGGIWWIRECVRLWRPRLLVSGTTLSMIYSVPVSFSWFYQRQMEPFKGLFLPLATEISWSLYWLQQEIPFNVLEKSWQFAVVNLIQTVKTKWGLL